MEATKPVAKSLVAPNLNLDINESKHTDEYYLAIEIKRIPFDGILRPLNILQGMFWDEIIYGFVLKTSKSLRDSWKAMPRSNKKAAHHRFAIKYGSKKEMEEFRDGIMDKHIGKDLIANTSNIMKKAMRQIPSKRRFNIRNINDSDLSSFDKLVRRLSEFGIILILPVEEDID